MIRKFFYIAVIGLSLIWGAETILKFDLPLWRALAPFIPVELGGIGIPANVRNIIGWSGLVLTAIFYLIGVVKVFATAPRDPWRAVLFIVALIAFGVGAAFYWFYLSGAVNQSSLYLILVMIVPFAPAVFFIPFITTFKEFLAPRKVS